MVRGQYAAGTGMLLQRRLMENVTNNITNADTQGYKKEYLVSHTFDEEMLIRINDPSDPTRLIDDPSVVSTRRAPNVGLYTFGTQVDRIYVDHSTGNYEETGRTTDITLVGDAFFVMETPDGERYTKAGAFVVNSEGYLTDGEGNYLLGENGRVFTGGVNFAVNELGDVIIGGEVVNRLRCVSFEDNSTLRKQGGNLFFQTGEPLAEANAHAFKQGFLENSNVDISREMVDMITLYRTYETNQRMLTMIDETVGKAVNDIGRLR